VGLADEWGAGGRSRVRWRGGGGLVGVWGEGSTSIVKASHQSGLRNASLTLPVFHKLSNKHRY
jgi:hypothetical protein